MDLDALSPDALAQNRQFTSEYLSLVANDPSDEKHRRLAWARMGDGTAFYHGKPNAFSYVPRIFGDQTRDYFAQLSQTAYRIMCKVLDAYHRDPAVRALFRFDPRVERLVELPLRYQATLPVTRVDFMIDAASGDVHFCEFNTDASSGMDETRNALNAVCQTAPYQEFCARYQCDTDMDSLFDGWVQTVRKLAFGAATGAGAPAAASTTASASGLAAAIPDAAAATLDAAAAIPEQVAQSSDARPHLGIVVCLEDPNPQFGELQTYAELFEAAGISCSIYDVRQLDFDGTRLFGKCAYYGRDNVAIDAVWRYCIVVDLLKYWDEVQPFINAIERGAVCMIGAFDTQIVHDKQLFALLRHPLLQALFTPDERHFIDRHIPETHFLDDEVLDLKTVADNPRDWVLKPTDWYASINVVAGAECSRKEWQAHLETALRNSDTSYLVQRFYAPSQTTTIPIYGNAGDFFAAPQLVGNLFGAYVYDGSFAGLYVRQGPHDVIGTARDGLVAPVLWVKERSIRKSGGRM